MGEKFKPTNPISGNIKLTPVGIMNAVAGAALAVGVFKVGNKVIDKLENKAGDYIPFLGEQQPQQRTPQAIETKSGIRVAGGIPGLIVPNSDFQSIHDTNILKADTIVCPANAYTLIGEDVIRDGQIKQFGYGATRGLEAAEGRLYIDLYDNNSTPAKINEGRIRIVVTDVNDRQLETLKEMSPTQARRGIDKIGDRQPLPAMAPAIPPHYKIQYLFNPGAAAITIKKAATKMEVDITVHDFRK